MLLFMIIDLQHQFRLVLILAFVFGFTACHTVLEPVSDTSVSVSEQSNIIDASAVLDSTFRFIQLQNPTSESVLNDVEKYLFSSDRVFAVDRRGNKIVAFKQDGGFVASTAKMVGKSGKEYISLWDASLDETNKLLYVYCDAPSRFIVLDYDLQFVRAIDFNYMPREFCISGHKLYSLNVDRENLNHFDLLCFDLNALDGKPDVLLSTDDAFPELGTTGKCLTACDNYVTFVMPFDSKIYTISDGEVKSVMHMDFGSLWYDKIHNDEKNISDFQRMTQDRHWMMVNVVQGKSTVVFNTNRFHTFVADIATQTCGMYLGMRNDIIPLSTTRIIPTQGLPSGNVIFSVSDIAIKICADFLRKKGLTVDRDFGTAIDHHKEGDNPLLIIWKLK